MRVYIHDELTDGKILQECLRMDVDVLTLAEVRARKAAPKGYDFFLDQVDVLIIEMSQPTQDIHFILAQAIIAQKPTLCLYTKNQPPRELLSYIKMKSAPRPLKTFSYTESSLEESVEQFIRRHDERFAETFDLPSIKFTLRLSPRMEEYLTWYADKLKLTKADALRELLQRQAKRDTEYRKVAGDE